MKQSPPVGEDDGAAATGSGVESRTLEVGVFNGLDTSILFGIPI